MIAKVCFFVKSRAEDIRDASRQTLSKVLTCLGMSHFPTIVSHLDSILVKGLLSSLPASRQPHYVTVYLRPLLGYQLNVLGYSLHYLISQNMSVVQPGALNSSLGMLVQVRNKITYISLTLTVITTISAALHICDRATTLLLCCYFITIYCKTGNWCVYLNFPFSVDRKN